MDLFSTTIRQIERNPYAHSFKYREVFWGLPCLLSRGNRQPNFYRPTVNFGFLVCYKLLDLPPYGFHLMNIFLNCTVTCLVFRVGSELFLTM